MLLALGLGAVDEGGPLFGVGIAKFPTAFTGRSRCDFVAQAAAGVDHKDVQEEGACGDGGGAGDVRSELGRKCCTRRVLRRETTSAQVFVRMKQMNQDSTRTPTTSFGEEELCPLIRNILPVICVSSPQSGGVSTPKSKREVT